MSQLDAANQQLKAMDESRQQLETQKHELEREIIEQRNRAEQAQAELTEQLQSVNVFKSMIADRDFRIETLENDVISLGNKRGKISEDAAEDSTETAAETPQPMAAAPANLPVPVSGGSAQ